MWWHNSRSENSPEPRLSPTLPEYRLDFKPSEPETLQSGLRNEPEQTAAPARMAAAAGPGSEYWLP
jgi:hypothetical protein